MTTSTQTDERRIASLLHRATKHVPTGFAEIEDLEDLANGREHLLHSGKYLFPMDVTKTLAQVDGFKVTGTLRYVGAGPNDPHLDKGNDDDIKQTTRSDKRYHVASMVELAINDFVFYTMPFPATGRKSAEHDQRGWDWVKKRMQTCPDWVFRAIDSCVSHR